jgi:hypothetical protein
MPSQTTENAFETYVEEIFLTRGGWKSGAKAEWDKDTAIRVHRPMNHDQCHPRSRKV